MSLLTIVLMPFLQLIGGMLVIPLSYLNIRMYRMNGTKMNGFIPKVKNASIWHNEEAEGYIWGWFFVGYINLKEGNHGAQIKELYLLTTKKFYKKQVENDDSETDSTLTDTIKYIMFYFREGAFWNLKYVGRKIKVLFTPTPQQQKAINQIIEDYTTRTYSVVLICGPPGSKKSMTSLLLCHELIQKSYIKFVQLVDSFNPTDPGDTLSNLYNARNPTEESPLVVVLEEIDGIITQVHNNGILPHKHMAISIKNKSEWNTFFDHIDRGLYPHMIFIMTTNKTKEELDAFDPSYLRKGRTNLCFSFEKEPDILTVNHKKHKNHKDKK